MDSFIDTAVPAGRPVGTLRALAVRPGRKAPPAALEHVDAIAGAGLEGDIHADALSPRQVLLAGVAAYAGLSLPPHALGENLLLDLGAGTECLTSGTVLQVGDKVLLRLMFQCEACGQLDAVRPGLAGVLGARRGVLARVLAGGTLHVGDAVLDLGPLLSAWSDDWRARVARVLDAVPPGQALDYALLARLAGVQSTYCRAFPRLLARFGPGYADRALPLRALEAAESPPRWDGRGLFDACAPSTARLYSADW